MATLLVLGSKPDPQLPPRELIDAVACANASGYSAAQLGLPSPDYTVMTAVLVSGKPSDDHSLRVLHGLSTRRLYLLPRPKLEAGGALRRLCMHVKNWRMSPLWMQRRLRSFGYCWEEFIEHPASWYHQLVRDLAGGDSVIAHALGSKQASTGLVVTALGLADERYTQIVMAGFDFTLTHAYGVNPLIAGRGTTVSKHAETDIAVLRAWVARGLPIVTSEPAVHAKAGVPFVGVG
jgi:hypothetical protein